MNYFNPYSLSPNRTIVAAWDSQVTEAAQTPWLKEELRRRDGDLFPPFAACYAELRALPRSVRRALQRQIARSSELAALFPEWFRSGGGRALQYKLARSLAGAALLLALGQGIVEAATINVTTTNPGVRRDKKCSLIEAIVNANNDAATHKDCPAGSGADTIVLPANADITLAAVNNKKIYGPTGLPVITSPITIQGNDAVIVRSTKKGKRPFRLIAVGNTGDLTLQDINLSGGSAPVDKGKARTIKDGGAILNHGTLSVENSTISGNTAPQGWGGGVFSDGTLTIANSTVSGNTAIFGGGVVNSGTLSIENSSVSHNEAGSGGGGVSNFGTLGIENSTISGNTAPQGGGGGVFSDAALTIANSTVSGNTGSFGGGIVNAGSGTLTIENSTISGNTANSSSGGGVYNHNGTVTIENSIISGNHALWFGGGIFNYGAVEVAGSTISDNSARSGGGAFNSWSYFSPNTLNIINSTISGNEASDDGGGIFNYRSGCGYYGCYFGGDLSLADSTITQNVAGNSGGGLFNEGSLNMTNSVIANNQAPTGPDIFP